MLRRDPPDKVVPGERPHGEEAGHGGGLVREDVHLHGVGAGDGEAGPRHAQPPRRVAQEREVRSRADQHQHVASLDTIVCRYCVDIVKILRKYCVDIV